MIVSLLKKNSNIKHYYLINILGYHTDCFTTFWKSKFQITIVFRWIVSCVLGITD